MLKTTNRSRPGGQECPSVDPDTIHTNAPVFLGYVNPIFRCLPGGGISYDEFIQGAPHIQGSLPKYQAGGVDVIVGSFSMNFPDLFPGRAGVGRVFQHLGAFLAAVSSQPSRIGIARQPGDVAALRASGKLAVILHLTSVFLDGCLETLHAYHALGVRSIHPSFDTTVMDRPRDWESESGLSNFGRDVVRTMDELGMVVDLAHASITTAYQALDLVSHPAIISHTMCRALHDAGRNTPDELHRAVAEQGGVIGVIFVAHDGRYAREIGKTTFVQKLRAWEDELRREFPDPLEFLANRFDYERWMQTEAYRVRRSVAPPDFAGILDHIDHLVDTVGIDHVGLGPDYDLGNMPVDVNSAEKIPNITRALVDRGYSKSDIRKILGENFLRVFGETTVSVETGLTARRGG